MWKAISHSSHISCLSGSCLPPQIWQAQILQVLFGLSLQALHTGPFCPVSKKKPESASDSSKSPDTLEMVKGVTTTSVLELLEI